MSEQNFDTLMSVYGSISDMTLSCLTASVGDLYAKCNTTVMKAQLLGIVKTRAIELGPDAVKIIDSICAALVKTDRLKAKEEARKENLTESKDFSVWLDTDRDGLPVPSLNNFCAIMTLDSHYAGVKFNAFKQALEIHTTDLGVLSIREWEEADYAKSMRFIEDKYHIYSEQKHAQALSILQSERSYNPMKDLVEALPPWDGVPRMEDFLHKWMGAEPTAYVSEVSRLIFAGGINRLYLPGCKFDEVPVLVGTKQGEGKSTIVRWLAMHDDYYAEITQMDGQVAIEQLTGAWIAEISEMLGVTKASEQEAVKAFLSRQVDQYRKPYARTVSKIPRGCVFIGTTNKRQFLSDKTGGRRFYPVKVAMEGYNLYQMEKDCRDYICLCWAEARDRYRKGDLPAYARRDLREQYREAQSSATEDDWREETIANFLKKFSVGERVCARQLQREALCMAEDNPKDPTRRESSEISLIMEKMPGWEKMKRSAYINPLYKVQKGWERVADELDSEDEERKFKEGLPF